MAFSLAEIHPSTFWPCILAIFSLVIEEALLMSPNLALKQPTIPSNAVLSSNRHSNGVHGTNFLGGPSFTNNLQPNRSSKISSSKMAISAQYRPYSGINSGNSKNYSASWRAASALSPNGETENANENDKNKILVNKLLKKLGSPSLEEMSKIKEKTAEMEKIEQIAKNLVRALAECDQINGLGTVGQLGGLSKANAKELLQLLHTDKYNNLLSVKGADAEVAKVKASLSSAIQLVISSNKRAYSDGWIFTKERQKHRPPGTLTREELEKQLELLNKLQQRKRPSPRYDNAAGRGWKSEEKKPRKQWAVNEDYLN